MKGVLIVVEENAVTMTTADVICSHGAVHIVDVQIEGCSLRIVVEENAVTGPLSKLRSAH